MSQRAVGRRRGSPVRTASGCPLVVVAIALFSSAMDLFWTRIDERRFPWAYAAPNRSTLTGAWVGALTTGRGATRGVYLDVRLDSLNLGSTGHRRRGSPSGRFRRAQTRKLEGNARVCGGPGEVDLHLRKGASAISGGDDPDTGRPAKGGLRRATEAEFQALCARLARAR